MLLLDSGSSLQKGVPFVVPKGPYVVRLLTKVSDVTMVSSPTILVVPRTCFIISDGAIVIYKGTTGHDR
jgi:hypothetical protein